MYCEPYRRLPAGTSRHPGSVHPRGRGRRRGTWPRARRGIDSWWTWSCGVGAGHIPTRSRSGPHGASGALRSPSPPSGVIAAADSPPRRRWSGPRSRD